MNTNHGEAIMLTTRIPSGHKAVIDRAKVLASLNNVTHCVVELDSADGRVLRAVRESYLLQEEFDAFGGVVLYAVHADGSVE